MDKELYRTTNFHVAVWLQINGIRLKSVDWVSRRKAEFVFEEFEKREELIEEFFNDQAVLQKFIAGSTELKARMYASNPPIEDDR